MTELDKELECPICGHRAELIDDGQDIVYMCLDCRYRFTTTESDTVWLERLKQKKEEK